VGVVTFSVALPALYNIDRVYTTAQSYQDHAIIALIAMSDNREPRCNNLSIVYSFNTGEKRKSGNVIGGKMEKRKKTETGQLHP
jgi:hypothetical protein